MKQAALRSLRKSAGLNRYDLQRDAGVSSTTIANIENGSDAHITTLVKISKALSKHLPKSEQSILLELAGLKENKEKAAA